MHLEEKINNFYVNNGYGNLNLNKAANILILAERNVELFTEFIQNNKTYFESKSNIISLFKLAKYKKYIFIFKLLIDSNCNLKLYYHNNRTLLLQCSKFNLTLFELLFNYYYNLNMIDYIKTIENSSQCNIIANLVDKHSSKIINIDTFSKVLSCFSIEEINKVYYGTTLLRDSIIYNHKDYTRILLENGADPNVKINYGCTVLHSLFSYCNVNNIIYYLELLLKFGADKNNTNQSNQRPYDKIDDMCYPEHIKNKLKTLLE